MPGSQGAGTALSSSTGDWKTRSVFEGYAIVSQSGIRDARVKLEAGQQDNAEAAQEKTSFGFGGVACEDVGAGQLNIAKAPICSFCTSCTRPGGSRSF